MEQEIIMALKTIKVYLASLNIPNNIILNKQLINWFWQKKYRFECFDNGVSYGQILFANEQIIINIEPLHTAYINLNEPHLLNFNFKINSFFVKGNFRLEKDPDYYVIVDCTLENSDRQIKFTLNKNSLWESFNDTINYTEKLLINPEEYIMQYTYENKDLKHQVNYEVLVQGMVPCMLKRPASLVTQKRMQFNQTCYEDKNYYSLNAETLLSLMQKLYPDFQNSCKEINRYLANWLNYLLDLANPKFLKEDLEKFLGIDCSKVLINNQTLKEYMDKTKVKTLTLERKGQ